MSDILSKRLQRSMDSLVFSDSDKKKICMQLRMKAAQKERIGTMKKRIRTRRIVAIAAVCIMVMGVAVFAAGKISSIVSHGHFGYDYKTSAKLAEAAESNDLEALPGEFSNGFKLVGGNKEDVEGADDSGNPVSTWITISADYKLGGKYITISEGRMSDGDPETTADDTKVINGIEASYRYYDYMFVPPDYEPDEETLEREKSDSHFTISYGTDEVSNEHADFVTFEKDGVYYTIMSFDKVSKDELFTIAEELIV